MRQASSRWGQHVRVGLGGLAVVVLILVGLGEATVALAPMYPPPSDIILSKSQVPAEFSVSGPLTGPFNASKARELGATGNLSWASGVTGWITELSGADGSGTLVMMVFNVGNNSTAADAVQSFAAGYAKAGYKQFAISNLSGAIGESAEGSVNGEPGSSSAVSFARSGFLFKVAAAAPDPTTRAQLTGLVTSLARKQADKAAAAGASAITQPGFDASMAAGDVVGVVLGYLLAVGWWAWLRDPLRRYPLQSYRRTRSRRASNPDSASMPRTLDVSSAARARKYAAAGSAVIDFAGATLIVVAFLPDEKLLVRILLGAAGVLIWIIASLVQRRRAIGLQARGFGGQRPVRVVLLFAFSAVMMVIAGEAAVLQAGLFSQSNNSSDGLGIAAGCFLAAAAISYRRARRLSSVSARRLLDLDQRPMVLYLRSFGDDRLRLRTAAFGRRSLVDRLSPSRFDSFEEVLVRNLNQYGPVIAINPPGMLLAPLGAARATMPADSWQAAVDEWMGRAAFIVMCAPSRELTDGLVWEVQQLTQRQLLSRTIIVCPPVTGRELQRRWQVFAHVSLPSWPFTAALPSDPADILALTRESNDWFAITAADRREWSYSAALSAAIGSTGQAGSNGAPLRASTAGEAAPVLAVPEQAPVRPSLEDA